MKRIKRGIQLTSPGYRDLTAEDITILEEELAKGNLKLLFVPGQEWKQGERIEATWNTSRFIVEVA